MSKPRILGEEGEYGNQEKEGGETSKEEATTTVLNAPRTRRVRHD